MPKYRLLQGKHIDHHPKDAHLPAGDRPDHVYNQGDVIDTDKDLCRFNGVGMDPKFERLHEDGTSQEKVDELHAAEDRVKTLEAELAALKAQAAQPVRAEHGQQPPQPATTTKRPGDEDDPHGRRGKGR